MAGVGIKRAMIGNIHHDREARTGPVKTMSAQWRELTRHAMRDAARVGVELGMFNGPGWSATK